MSENGPSGSVEAEVLGIEGAARPPKSVWSLRVTLRNDASEPRWFLLSDPLEDDPSKPRNAPGARIDALETPAGEVRRLLVHSTDELLGFRLPAGASLVVEPLELETWKKEGVETLKAVSAEAIQADGAPLVERWLDGRDMLVPDGVERVDPRNAAKLAEHMNEDLEMVPIGLERAASLRAPLDTSGLELPWAGSETPGAGPDTFGPAGGGR